MVSRRISRDQRLLQIWGHRVDVAEDGPRGVALALETKPQIAFVDVDPAEYSAIVIPGGRAPEFIRVDPEVRRIVEHFFAEEKPVGTLCHGPQVPAALGLLQGRRSSGFGPLAPDIELAGAEYVDGAAVVDGNMVSCRGWGDLADWSRAFLECLDRAAVPA